MTALAHITLDWLTPSSKTSNHQAFRGAVKALMVVVGVALLTLSAKINVPFHPVPMTMQTYVVSVLAAFLGLRLGMATILSYMALGMAGFSVFAGTPEKGIGLAYMAGPTGGFLIGFVLATLFIGWTVEKMGWDRSFLKGMLLFVGGTLVIFASGLIYMGFLLGWDKPILEYGLYPFIWAGILKFALAAVTMNMLWRVTKKIQ